MGKIIIIRNKILSDSTNITYDIAMWADIMVSGKIFKMFRPTSEVDVTKIITESLNKSCDLDALLTCLLNKCEDQLVPLITGHYQ